jgi:hypothetical protein
VRLNVYVCCAAGVVTGEDRGELDNAIIISGLETTEEGGVKVGGVAGVAVPFRDNAGVDTGGVAVPDVSCEVDDGEACRDVDEL